MGDTAVCVNPEDERYKALIGKNVIVPLINRKVKIIADSYVDKSFGSGVVKITPAHDFNDYKIGKAHNLDFINILTKKTTMNENAGPYQGLSVIEARKKVIEDLKNLKNLKVLQYGDPLLNFDSVKDTFISPPWNYWFWKGVGLGKKEK